MGSHGRSRASLILALAAILAVSWTAGPARSDGTPTADIVASLSGPNSGNVGDTLTFTVTATNKGPDAGAANVWFAMQKNAGLSPIDWSPACPSNDSPDQWIMQCNNTGIAVGGQFQLTVHVHVDAIKETTVDGLAGPSGINDPDTSNNAASFPVFPATSSPPPPPPPPVLTPPPYHFVDSLPEVTDDGYSTIQFLACPDGSSLDCTPGYSPSTAVVAGSLPPGMKVDSTEIVGLPYLAGSYTFTLETTLPGVYTAIDKEYTLVVQAHRKLSTGTPPPILPNRLRTPGVIDRAVTQGTIKKTICLSGWTASVRPPVSYTDTLKLKQIKQFGDPGRPSAYEEDNLIPLELGGAPRNPKNLWPEPHSQSKHSDPLETQLKRNVCRGVLSLAAARAQILTFKRKHG